MCVCVPPQVYMCVDSEEKQIPKKVLRWTKDQIEELIIINIQK